MKVLGFNFKKISAERFSNSKTEIKIGVDTNILEIQEARADFLNEKEKALGIKFITIISYEPGFAKIELAGEAILSLEASKLKQVLEGWKKKDLPEEFEKAISNLILMKSSLRALPLEEELALPPHIQFSFSKTQEKK